MANQKFKVKFTSSNINSGPFNSAVDPVAVIGLQIVDPPVSGSVTGASLRFINEIPSQIAGYQVSQGIFFINYPMSSYPYFVSILSNPAFQFTLEADPSILSGASPEPAQFNFS